MTGKSVIILNCLDAEVQRYKVSADSYNNQADSPVPLIPEEAF